MTETPTTTMVYKNRKQEPLALASSSNANMAELLHLNFFAIFE